MKRFNLYSSLIVIAALTIMGCKEEDPITNDPMPNPTPSDSIPADTIPADTIPTPTKITSCWPNNYGGVMLQGFYWNSYTDSQWQYLESQAKDIAPYFSLIWVPNSGYCSNGNNMGYLPYKFFTHDSSFGSEENLRSMINTYKEKGTGIIADVVINHHNTEGWFGFPAETYKGVIYQFSASDICSNDDNGATATQASKDGISLSKNTDTGEGWDGCRDLDHNSDNVQTIIKAYTKYLLNDLGYAGFRYDMVKGYSPKFTGLYNADANPRFSVGEYWDGNATTVQNWIDGTKVQDSIQSAAFDFCFRYTCRDAANGDWSKLMSRCSATQNTYNRYAVTFVENHDTELRSATEQQDPIRCDTLALNAWLIANPGTPCVFYKHWQAYKKEIKLMIEARRLAGISNTSKWDNITVPYSSKMAARAMTGSRGKLLVCVGPDCKNFTVPEGYSELLTGYHYRYFIADGYDKSSWETTVSRINEEEKAVAFEPHTATIYVNASFSPLYFYIWDSNNNTQLNGNWPGKQMTETIEKFGIKWYSQTIDINKEGYYFNIIFNQGNGKPQTADIGHLSTDHYYTATISGTTVNYVDVTSQYIDK